MNQEQINWKEMFDSSLMYFDSNPERWSSIPKVSEFKTEFSGIVLQIGEAIKTQADAQVFLGRNKKQLKLSIAA